MKMKCEVCEWIYEPEKGCPAENIPPGTKWGDVPSTFACPECGAGKDSFIPV